MEPKKEKKIRWQAQLIIAIVLVVLAAFGLNFILSSSLFSETPHYSVDTTEDVRIVIDPGHGGFDPGKSAPEGIREADINLAIARKVKTYLLEMNPNVHVMLTRDTDTVSWADNELDDLNYRTSMQADWQADYFISIHGNSFEDPTVKGYAFYIRPDDEVSRTLSENIDQAFKDNGWSELQDIITTDRSPLQVISMSENPAVLIETGYMTNPEDLAGLQNVEVQDKIALSIAQGIMETLQSLKADAGKQDTAYKMAQTFEPEAQAPQKETGTSDDLTQSQTTEKDQSENLESDSPDSES